MSRKEMGSGVGPAPDAAAAGPTAQETAAPPTDAVTPASPTPASPTPAPARRARAPLFYVTATAVTLLVLATLAVWIWKAVAVRGLEARLAEERTASTSAQRQALDAQARDLLRLTARPLAWSVRAELLRGNVGQVDDYFRELVRERGVSSLIFVDEKGRIALATNRKLETQAASSVIAPALLEAAELASEETGSSLRLAVPVMAFDRRLGTLVIDYDLRAR